MCRSAGSVSSGSNSESTSEQQPKRGRLLQHGRLLQGRSDVLLQGKDKARQECSRLLQGHGQQGVLLLQGRLLPDAQQEERQFKQQLAFAGYCVA